MRALVRCLPLLLAACGGGGKPSIGPQHADIPVYDPALVQAKGDKKREPPPPTGALKEAPFPAAKRQTLANGLRVATIEAHALPIVQIRVLVGAGMGYGPPGVAQITGDMLKDGGTRTMTSAALLNRVETMGASIGVDTDFDRTVVSIGVTKSHVAEALSVLAEMVQSPRFDEGELGKLKARQKDDAEDNARSNGQWSATRLVFRELFATTNPYSRYDMLPSEIAKVTGAAVRDFHKKFYVPKNAEVILVGDIDPQTDAMVQKSFGSWAGGEIPKVDFPPANPPAKRRVVLAHRPKSAQSDIFVVCLAPARNSADWPALRVANMVLGGGVASRLFLDVREQRSLAYNTRSSILELKNGPQPLLGYAGTESKKTGLAIQGILDNFTKIIQQPIPMQEVTTARRYLSDIFAVRMETVGAIADLMVQQDALGLPDGYWEKYRTAVRATDDAAASSAAKQLYFPDKALIIVAGDADVIGGPLSHFGEVTVVDPEKELATIKSIPENTSAPIEP